MLSLDDLRRLDCPEFNALLASDPELNRLAALRYDEAAENLLLAQTLRFGLMFGELPVQPLTAARWSFLWMARNAYTTDGPPTDADRDIFLYVLTHDLHRIDCPFDALPGAASGYSRATGMRQEEVHRLIRGIIRAAFLPLGMLPHEAESSDPLRYDTEWLVRISSLAARESGTSIDFCKFEMSLGEACALFVDHQRRNAEPDYARRIRRQSDGETTAQMMRRVRQLQEEFLRKGRESCPN